VGMELVEQALNRQGRAAERRRRRACCMVLCNDG